MGGVMSADQRRGQTRHAPVKLLAVLLRLQELAALWRVVVLEVGLDRLVLLVELRQVRHEVLDDVHCVPRSVIPHTRSSPSQALTVRERVDLGVLARVAVDAAQTRERVLAVDVHGTRAANSLST